MEIKATDIAKLRKSTGVGMMDAKKALVESGGDFDKAIDALRKAGAAKAAKKADREAVEGYIATYIHGEGRIGVMVEVNCETDFVAKNDDFKALAHEIALHIAAMNPLYITEEDIPAEVLEKEKELVVEQLKSEGKPADRLEQIVEGKLAKYMEEVVLLNQPFVKDDKKSVGQLIQDGIQKIGENIQVTRFARFTIEGNPNACRI
ncbi:translation elongation factor Ts [Candidatus Berkelbacteria bacterium]|nr:translation elongation factor Ts [Candidatus Berkelbacteria bacterium]